MTDSPPQATTSAASSSYRSFLLLAVLVLLGLMATAGVKSFRDLAAARGYEAELQERIDATGRRIDELERDILSLDDDPLTLERMAREQLGLVRPGDVVIVLPDDEP